MNIYVALSILLGENLLLKQQEKYKLIKENKYEKCKIVEAPNKNAESESLKDIIIDYMNYSIKDFEQKNNDIEIPENIKISINKFLAVLSKNLPEEQLKFIKKNLNTLKYKEKKGILMTLMKEAGSYSLKKHEISINNLLNKKIDFKISRFHIYSSNLSEEEKKLILNHELFHAITTFEGISGFSQKNIGTAINEGYTELINKKIFFNEMKEKDYFKNTGYPYEYRIAKIIELIIGEDKMQNLYLNADLNGLINELSKYQNRNKVIQFIKDTDDIKKIRSSNFTNKEEIYSILNIRIQKFLYSTYSNKFDKEVNYKNISEYLEKQNIFQEELDNINGHKKIIKEK